MSVVDDSDPIYLPRFEHRITNIRGPSDLGEVTKDRAQYVVAGRDKLIGLSAYTYVIW